MPGVVLTPEERLLLALGRRDPSERGWAEATRLARHPGLDWQGAIDLAQYHRVGALLAHHLDDAALREVVPAEFRAVLQRIRMAGELRNERYAHALAPIFARLDSEGVPVLLLKGAALAATIYPPGCRPLNDIDVLIRPRDYGRVTRALEGAGFRKVLALGRSEAETLADYHEVSFVKPVRNATLALDVHWRLYTPDRSSRITIASACPSFEDLLARAVPIRLGPARALATSAEDVFVHSATQIGMDGLEVHLGRLADLDALVASGLDWRKTVEISVASGVAGTTHLALALLSSMGARVPAGVCRRLAGACPTCPVAGRVLAHGAYPLGRRSLRTAALVALLPLLFGRPWHRLAYYASLFIPTPPGGKRVDVLPTARGGAAYRRRLRAAVLAGACGILLLLEAVAVACGLDRLGGLLRGLLWTGAKGPLAGQAARAVRTRAPAPVA